MTALDLQEPSYHFWLEPSLYAYYRNRWIATGSVQALHQMLQTIRYQPGHPRDDLGRFPNWRQDDA